MNAIWLENRQVTLRRDLPLPVPGEDEALIQVRLAGICGTDLEMVRGYRTFAGVLGHEFVGEVAAAPGDPSWVGRRVTGEINVVCGSCRMCLAGHPHHCEQRTVIGIQGRDGVFAGYLILPFRNLHAIPEGVADEMAVFTEPLAAALEIQEQVHLQPGMRVLLVGAGRLGQLIAQTLALTACDLQVAVRSPKARRALEAGCAGANPPELVALDEARQRYYDVVVEASGAAEGFELARRAVHPAGTIVLKSTFTGETPLNLSGLVVDEITLVGSRCGPFEPALRLMKMGLVRPQVLIEDILPLADGLKALSIAGEKGKLKVLIRP